MRKTKEEILKDNLAKKDEEIRKLKEELSKTQNELDLARLSNELVKAKTDEMMNTCEKTCTKKRNAIYYVYG